MRVYGGGGPRISVNAGGASVGSVLSICWVVFVDDEEASMVSAILAQFAFVYGIESGSVIEVGKGGELHQY